MLLSRFRISCVHTGRLSFFFLSFLSFVCSVLIPPPPLLSSFLRVHFLLSTTRTNTHLRRHVPQSSSLVVSSRFQFSFFSHLISCCSLSFARSTLCSIFSSCNNSISILLISIISRAIEIFHFSSLNLSRWTLNRSPAPLSPNWGS